MILKERQLDGAIVVIAIATIIYVAYYLFPLRPGPGEIPFADSSYGSLIVGLHDEGNRSGVYYLPDKADIHDLLKAAGVRNVEIFDKRILRTELSTGSAAFITADNELKVREMDNASKVALNIPININKAALSDFMLISGIGEKTAGQIIQFRERSGSFKKLEDLMKIRGIKEKKFAKLKRHFSIGQD